MALGLPQMIFIGLRTRIRPQVFYSSSTMVNHWMVFLWFPGFFSGTKPTWRTHPESGPQIDQGRSNTKQGPKGFGWGYPTVYFI